MKTTRRKFVKSAVLASASLPLFNIGRAGTSPNSVIRHANLGAWGKGRGDIQSMLNLEGVELAAIAEVDDEHIAKIKKQHPDVKFKVYKDWRKLLEKEHKNLDTIAVSTPDHMHAIMGLAAMQHGLHVYGQKPLTQTVYEARRMTDVARETGVVTQMGVQFTSSTYERLTVKMVQDGVVGKIRKAYVFSHKTWGDPDPIPASTGPAPASLDWDQWLGVAEDRPYIDQHYHPKQWRKRLDFGTGTLGDMGCHIYSPMYRALKLGAPNRVKSVGGKPNATNWAINEKMIYEFPGTPYTEGETIEVEWCDGELRPPERFLNLLGSKMPQQGCIFVGTEGMLLQGHQALPVPYPREKFKDYRYPKLKPRDHYEDFLAAVKGEKVKPLADFIDFAGPLTETVLLGSISSRFPNEVLNWDAKKLAFTNNEKANEFITRKYRKGWELS